MRVIAGRWKGHRLVSPYGDSTRPTTNRVKESLFSILGNRLAGEKVIDLYCGSGALGIEALSRGAGHVTFVDSAFKALQAVRINLKTLKVEPELKQVIRKDAITWLKGFLYQDGPSVWLLADPPYDEETALKLIALATARPDRILGLILEHEPLESMEIPEGWQCDRRQYGRTEISILEYSS
jgi:16S rRNA (guanine966-N2)-methyltransferase